MMTSYIYLVVVIVIATFSSESHGIPVHNTRKTTLLDQPLNVLQPRIPILIKSISSEYLPPMEFPSSEVMPQKRSAMLINKFMKDVQRAFENFPSDDNGGSNGLQARDGGQNSEDSDRNESKKKFTRCYLNAASCFY